MTLSIRRARADDVPDMLRLIVALAANEGEADAVKATPGSLAALMFGPVPKVFAHVAELEGAIVGVALWFETYSTWTGRLGLYLEDLFVDARARGTGAGRALMMALAREAKARDCARIDWALHDTNPDARGFYESMGAFHSTGWRPWRLEGAALDRLAEGNRD